MVIVPFIPFHLRGLRLHESQEYYKPFMCEEYGQMLFNLGPAYTVRYEEEAIMCAGIMMTGKDRAEAWALVSLHSGPAMLGITRKVKEHLDGLNIKRIEAVVKDGFEEGHRWMKMLGFKCETPDGMEAHHEDGGKNFLYARIK